MPDVPKDAQKKLEEIKKRLDQVKEKVTESLGKYVTGIALMPPSKDEKGNVQDVFNVLFLVDDTDNQFFTKEEVKAKAENVIKHLSAEVDKRINPTVVILTELWQGCYDAKYDLLQLIAMSAPVHDTGMLSAIKIAEIHKSMVLKKFEKYIVSYVLAGSLVQGKATPESDIDVFVVIDDTDVKKMTRTELKDKLRAIIIGMGIEAGELTGIHNKLNVQVYILTDFWDSIKEANPVIFTFLRDGVPFYDRGIFMPWKQLLKMGKIKPSMEAIDMYMQSGEQMLERVGVKIKEIGMEDIFYALLTPSQAALMLYGLPPPTPKETPDLMNEVFVKKEKLLEAKYITTLRTTIQTRKELEHGSKKELTGKELDDLLKNAQEYLKRIKKLFEEIEKVKQQENLAGVFDTIITLTRDLLKSEGCKEAKEENLAALFKTHLSDPGHIPQRYYRLLADVMKLKKKYDKDGKLNKTDNDQLAKKSKEFMKQSIEHLQRKQSREYTRGRFRFAYGEDKAGECTVLKEEVLLVLDGEEKHYLKADPKKLTFAAISSDEFEGYLEKGSTSAKPMVTTKLLDAISKAVGSDVHVLLG